MLLRSINFPPLQTFVFSSFNVLITKDENETKLSSPILDTTWDRSHTPYFYNPNHEDVFRKEGK